MKITEYKITNDIFSSHLMLAVVADLHAGEPTEVLSALEHISPDYIIAPGDIFEPLISANEEKNRNGFEFLRRSAKIAPTVMSLGNHEIGGTRSWNPKWRLQKGKKRACEQRYIDMIRDSGVQLLDNSYICLNGIIFGGLTSGIIADNMKPDTDFIDAFEKLDAPKVLLCHHPEYYDKYLADSSIDLIVSGHAHGGQWRFFGRGLFAPGQGIFPKYTRGIHHGRFVISSGLKVTKMLPRIFNEPEIVKIVIN